VTVDGADSDCSAGATALTTAPTVTSSTGVIVLTVSEAFTGGTPGCVLFARDAGITNPTTAATYDITLATSQDTSTATDSVTIVAQTSPAAGAVTLSSTTAEAENVTVEIDGTVSSQGALANGDTVTVTFPSGFTVPSGMTAANFTTDDDADCTGATAVSAISQSGQSVTGTWAAGAVANSGTIVLCFLTGAGIDNPTPGSYTITVATSRDLTADNADSLTISAGSASEVLFTTQPATSGGVINQAWSVQPVVKVEDSGDNGVSGQSVALTIASGPSGAVLTCTVNPVTTNSSGSASFTGCRVDMAGDYTLTATSEGTLTGTSSSFTIASAPSATPTSTPTSTSTPTETPTPTNTTVPGATNTPAPTQGTAIPTSTPVTPTTEPTAMPTVTGASLSVSPDPVPGGDGNGSATVTWNTGSSTSGDVVVSTDGGSDVTIASGASGTSNVTWIQAGHSYRFRLMQGSTTLAEQWASRSVVAPSITASPNPVDVTTGSTGTTTISFYTGNGSNGQVYVSFNSGPEVLFMQNVFGSQDATWIQENGIYRFTLYQGTTQSTAMASVDVMGS
jgi:hypothetical protein